MQSLRKGDFFGVHRRVLRITATLLPLALSLPAGLAPRARAGAPLVQMELKSITAIYIGKTPAAFQTYIGQESLLFLDAKDWKPLRISGSAPKSAPLATGTLMYQQDERYEHSTRLTSFVAGPPIPAEAIQKRAGKSPLGAVVLSHAVSPKDGLATLEATRRELSDEGYAWGLRVYDHGAELVSCAKQNADCFYELIAQQIEAGRFAEAAELLTTQRASFDRIASALHDTQEYHCAPVATPRGGANPATGLSWAALIRIGLLEHAGMKPKADAERDALTRRAPRYAESTSERYYEGYAPLDHVLFKHDRPRVLYQRATEQRPPNP